jgi:hypothetical protein
MPDTLAQTETAASKISLQTGRAIRFLSVLQKLDLQRLATDQPLKRRGPRLVLAQELGRRHVLIERTGLRLVDPDPDQVARQVMASAERVQRLPGMVFGDDLALEVDAVAAVSGHGPSSSESPPPVNRQPLDLSSSRGALHIGVQFWL